MPGRRVDDNVQIMLRFAEGARGLLWASQVAPGNQNNLRLRVFGEKAGIEWRQEDPNCLWFAALGKAPSLIYRAGPAASPVAAHASRVPSGHPEGYLEAFAQLYADMAEQISARIEGAAGRLRRLCSCPRSRMAWRACALFPLWSNRPNAIRPGRALPGVKG